MASVLVRVTGAVQGVGYRWFVRERADARGVTGWVRNRRDGSVEAELHGSDTRVDAVVRELREGPPHAVVESVTATDITDPPSLPIAFTIRETA